MIVLCFLICCTPKQENVERIIKDGVEVVLNRIEPYAVTETNAFTLEKTLTIDTENDEIAEMGLTGISHVDVDSKGKIFLANRRATNSCVFIFDKAGLFVSAFGNRGQGPGEFQNPDVTRSRKLLERKGWAMQDLNLRLLPCVKGTKGQKRGKNKGFPL
jgi:hypothetical protein